MTGKYLSTPSPEDVVAVLARAADRLERGWCQGVVATWNDREVCVMGALMLECGLDPRGVCGNPLFSNAFLAVTMELGLSIPLVTWNDAPGRTKEEVVTLVRNAKRQL